MTTEAERRLTTVPWQALAGLGPLLGPALDEVLSGTAAERVLDRFLRAHRDFDEAQRKVSAESIFGVGLWRRRLRAQLDGEGLELLAVLALELGGFADAATVLGVELNALGPVPSDWRDRFSFPDWIAEHLQNRFGDETALAAEAFNRPGPVCLRARGSREELRVQLAAAGVECTLGNWASKALVVTTPRPNLLGLGPQFLGQFEVQDEGSQLLGELVAAGPGFYSERHRVMQFALSKKIPTIVDWRWPPGEGMQPMLVYGAPFSASMRQAALYVVRILRDGVKPGDLPIVQPSKFELVVNRKTAKTIGLTIPQSLLARADEVIE